MGKIDLQSSYLTKQQVIILLNKKGFTQEDVFERYLNVTVNYIDSFPNVLRGDIESRCKFTNTRQDGTVTFIDWSRGKHYDMIDIVQSKFRVSYMIAVKIILSDFGIIEKTTKLDKLKQIEGFENNNLSIIPKSKKKSDFSLKVKRRNILSDELDFWKIEGLTINQDVLNKNNIFTASSFWEYKGDKLIAEHIRVKNTFIYHNGGYNYQLYRPFAKKRRFITTPEIHYLDYEFLRDDCDYVIITKSKKDAFYLRLCGFNAFCIIHEHIKLSKDIMDDLHARYERVYTYFDNDRTGLSLAWWYRNTYRTIPYFNRIVSNNIFDKSNKLIKDFTDVLKNKGLNSVLKFKKQNGL